jgi:uncharacterized protein (TIRG00374 family)
MRLGWRGALGIGVSAALLWWALRGVQLAVVVAHLRAANAWLLGAAVVAATLIYPLRARRWRTILSPIVEDVPFGPLWRSTAIGMMVNSTVPARVGEIARAYALTREVPAIPFSASFASLAVDRVFDAVVTMLLMLVAVLDPNFPRANEAVSSRVANTIGVGTILVVVSLGLLYLLLFLPQRIIGLYERISRRVAPQFEERGRDVLLAFAAGLGVLRSPRRFAAVFGWTLAHWLLCGLAFWLGFRALGIRVGFTAALLVQGVVAVGVAVPQAPGFWGVFEAAAKWALVDIYGVDAGRAVSWAIGFHVVTFIPITVIGAIYFVRMGLNLRQLRTVEPPRDGEFDPSQAV